jgi:triacylglycerol esterase/lipase EstA (alpha/beta hydrolase family)/ferritin-like metal-binding protein YciE
MQIAREFFIRGLEDMYDAEQKILHTLDEQITESSRPDVQKAFAQHREQTVKQVERVRQCFDEIGQQAEGCEAGGIEGLVQEHDHFKQAEPSKDLLDMSNVEAATKVERYEITSYLPNPRNATRMLSSVLSSGMPVPLHAGSPGDGRGIETRRCSIRPHGRGGILAADREARRVRIRALAMAVALAGCGGSAVGLAGDGGVEALPPAEDAAPPDVPPTCDPTLPVVDQGLLATGAAMTGTTLPACTMQRFAFVGAEGSSLKLAVRVTAGHGLEVAIAYPDTGSFTDRLAHLSAPAGGGLSVLPFQPPRSGEFFLYVRSSAPTAESTYDLTLSCTGGCDREATRFPIVLVHGWTGWDSIGSYEYFYQVPETLRGLGYRVTVVTLDPYNSIEKRSGQLAPQVDQALVDHHARKVDLIAHSQGGLDSRRLISTLGYGDRVSSLVTVATPHRGTAVCDVALGYLPGFTVDMTSVLLNLLGAAVSQQSDAEASFHDLSEKYVQEEFNPQTPDDPRVAYSSWAGQTCGMTDGCGAPVHFEIAITYEILLSAGNNAGANDGVVAVASAPWGSYHGTVLADHFDEVGQLAGDTGSFDHLLFYENLARNLAIEGH